MDPFLYKIQMEKYYVDVEIDMDSIVSVLKRLTGVCSMLQYVDIDLDDIAWVYVEIEMVGDNIFHYHQ